MMMLDIWMRPTTTPEEGFEYLSRSETAKRAIKFVNPNGDSMPNWERTLGIIDILREWPHYAQLVSVQKAPSSHKSIDEIFDE